ncbi:hypothetical protein FF38_10792 [Lucilia cuprina]|uniref:Uncharacterized protein n=1 Tax=Lucilia cuprina TaxID=7375 RepID=A0A0L0BMU3_LUCCU|nr:hypothetical protein CVS40_12315 [Lucilia cuprina]KNC21327.1 hypothetical protein FF38_10792 [Lucilia cuprina]
MKVLQVAFVVACIIAAVSCNPGHNVIKGNSNQGNKQTNFNAKGTLFH